MHSQPAPLSSSTPGNPRTRLSARRGVHDVTDDDFVSPIKSDKSPSCSPPGSPYTLRRKYPRTLPESQNSTDTEPRDDRDKNIRERRIYRTNHAPKYSDESDTKKKQKKLVEIEQSQNTRVYYLIIGFISIAVICYKLSEASTCVLDSYKHRDMWRNLYTGISEMKQFQRPSVFMLLYNKSSEETLEEVLRNISSHVNCVLRKVTNDSENTPIVLSGKELRLPELMEDYGIFIDKYKPELERKNVMIIKNLDEVPWPVVGAFHSICDEYTPLVGQSVIVFTIKVEDFPEDELKFVETMLKHKWSGLREDHFDPLFARISGMILKIHEEN